MTLIAILKIILIIICYEISKSLCNLIIYKELKTKNGTAITYNRFNKKAEKILTKAINEIDNQQV